MTTKQIAESVGKAEKTVRTWAFKAAAKSAEAAAKSAEATPTHPADWTLDETIAIIETGMGKSAAQIYRMNAVQRELPKNGADARLDRLESITEKLLLTMGNMMLSMQGVQAKAEIASLPAPSLSPRDELRRIVNKAAKDSGDFAGTWKTLYSEIYYRLHINTQERAKNAKVPAIEILESEGLLFEAVAIAKEVFTA